MIDDIRTLGSVNQWVAAAGSGLGARRRPRTKPAVRDGYREIPYLFVGPRASGHLGAQAGDIFRARYRGWRSWGDFGLLVRLLGGYSAQHGELLSYLFFDSTFLAHAIDAGRADARQLLGSGDARLPWRSTPHRQREGHRGHRRPAG